MHDLDNRVAAPHDALWFTSRAMLDETHTSLLQRRREDADSDAFWRDVVDFVRRMEATGAILDTDEVRWPVQSLLDFWSNALYRARGVELDPVLSDFDPTLLPMLEESARPYVGMEAFGEEKSELFFGRQRLIEDLAARLASNRLVVVLGPSGSGKSSVVRAGVMRALKNGMIPGSEGWRYLSPIVPGADPLLHLTRLARSQPELAALEPPSLDAYFFERDPQHLCRLLGGPDAPPCVLVVDQFEELFTLGSSVAVRTAYVANLVELLKAEAPAHRVILTLRSDFEANLARLTELQPFVDEARFHVTPLTATELREAIEKPAERVGLKFEKGIVDELVQEILGEPAGLPLLQFTMLKLWEARDHDRVTWAAFKRLGGARMALANSADGFYRRLIPQDQEAARRILLRMVRPTEGLETTSNRIPRESLFRPGEPREQVERVLDRLVNEEHLVRQTEGDAAGEVQVEVAHEALVRNWPQLAQWLAEEREAIRTRQRLEANAAEWNRLGGTGGLLDAVQLEEAVRWLGSDSARILGYDRFVEEHVEASRVAIEREREERKRIAAERIAVRRRALIRRIVFPIVFLLLAVAATGFNLYSRDRQRRQLREQSDRQQQELITERMRQENEYKVKVVSDSARVARRQADALAEANDNAERERAAAVAARESAQVALVRATAARDSLSGALALSKKREVELRTAIEARNRALEDADIAMRANLRAQAERNAAVDFNRIADQLSRDAHALADRGDDDGAEKTYRELLAEYARFGSTLGDSILARGRVETLVSLAELARGTRRFDESDTLLTQALEVGRRLLGSADTALVGVYNARGALARDRRDYASAASYFGEAVVLLRRQGSSRDAELRSALTNLARAYRIVGRFAEAEALLQEVLAMQTRRLGSDNWWNSASYIELGDLYLRKRDLPRARSFYERALALRSRLTGPNHWGVVEAYDKLGDVAQAEGRLEEAERQFGEALRLQGSEQLKPDVERVAYQLWAMARVYSDRARYEDAERLLLRAAAIQDSIVRASAYRRGVVNYATYARELGRLYLDRQKPRDAAAWLQRAIDSWNRLPQQDPVEMARALTDLGHAYREQGDLATAERYYRGGLENASVVGDLMEGQIERARALNGIGRVLARQRPTTEPDTLFLQALAIRERVLGPEHVGVSHSLHDLAAYYMDHGQLERADSLFRRAYRIRSRYYDPWHPRVLETLDRWATVLHKLGRKAEAEEMERQNERGRWAGRSEERKRTLRSLIRGFLITP